ncbi:nuclear transport factor 2 family protein [Lysobacter sp. KIS68-7]|uniref:nuclear transport factor 2 family protein n=1 Tax=Lysobacter sp. KIS68-7 TaxID=2904252 RepID=UPI001E380F09|nr:nuclear transport factor 2 family protein [Lysobacter sp. KIS68-7]UHQ19870.1 nuclear transport factor 2 family protein [Lysobacter sp. KIS68-7]
MIRNAVLSCMLLFALSPMGVAGKQDTKQQVAAALEAWNAAASRGDIDAFMQQFDPAGEVLLAGSDHGEVFRDQAAIRTWVSGLFEHHRFSWDLSHADIDSNGNTAWVFVDGTMTLTNDVGETSRTPYRFSGVMVKHGDAWKWRMFDGSIPAGE